MAQYHYCKDITELSRAIATHVFVAVQHGKPVGEIRFCTDEVPTEYEWFYLDTEELKENAFRGACGRYKVIDLAPQFYSEDAHMLAGGYLGGNVVATTGLIDRDTGILTMEDSVRAMVDYMVESVEQVAPRAILLQIK